MKKRRKDADSMRILTVRIPPYLLGELDKVVQMGEYHSRGEAARDAIRSFVNAKKADSA